MANGLECGVALMIQSADKSAHFKDEAIPTGLQAALVAAYTGVRYESVSQRTPKRPDEKLLRPGSGLTNPAMFL